MFDLFFRTYVDFNLAEFTAVALAFTGAGAVVGGFLVWLRKP